MNSNPNLLFKKLLIAVIIILTLIAAAALIYSYFYPRLPVAVLPPENTMTNQEVIDKTAALIKANDLAGCDSVKKIVNGTDYQNVCRDNILNNLAKKNLDFKSCDSLSKPSLSGFCQRDVLALWLEKEKNIAVCDRAPETLKPGCPDAFWAIMAKAEAKPELCAKITFPVGASNCQERVFIYMLQQGKTLDCRAFTNEEVKKICALPEAERKQYSNYRF